ncbi:Invertase [Lecanora helva]
MSPLLVFILVLACKTLAQSSASAYVEPHVPTGKPIPGNYGGSLRPQIHYSPPIGFMNDPNGMFVDADGLYHLYYQYNPTGLVAGNQHWGHATSKDLYHWENQPIAIFPGAEGEGIFSGSAVIDVNNTSDFFPNQTNGVVAMYTLNTMKEQTQEIAYSTDGGYTFTKYSGNPVISINSTQFRDPKVLWYAATQSWVAVIAYAQAFTIGIFTSPDLKTWTHASNFTHQGLLGLQYECPNLIPIPMLKNASIADPFDPSNFASTNEMYILQISINPGAPLGGSTSQYFPGTFNGTHFTPSDGATRLTDFAKDNYAGQYFYNVPSTSPQLSLAWASNWEYAQVVPTGPLEDFRSFMTLPRQSVLANTSRAPYTLLSYPYNLPSLYTTPFPLAKNPSLLNTTLSYNYTTSTLPSAALAFSLNITSIPAANATGTVNFTLLPSSTGESIRGGLFLSGSGGADTPLWLDRGHARGFDNPFFSDKFSTDAWLDIDTRSVRLLGVLDRSVLEVFLNGGQKAGTMSFFLGGEIDGVVVGTGDLSPGVGVEVEVWGLESGWGGGGNGNWTVAGQEVRRDFSEGR